MIGNPMTGEWWPDFFYTITIIIPNVAAVCLGYLTFKQSQSNARKLNKVESALNGREGGQTEPSLPLDRLDKYK